MDESKSDSRDMYETHMEMGLRRVMRTLSFLGVAFLAVLAFFLLASGPAAADTPVSGSITTDTTWTQAMSPIWVEGSITVTSGATLTIDPGVDVRFDGYYSLTMSSGALVADGDAAGAGVITFTSNFTDPWPGAWAGINVYDDTGGSLLDDVVISYASTGITFADVSVPVTNSQILNSQWYGVYISSSTTPYDLVFSGTTIADAGSYGIYIATQIDNDLSLRVLGSAFSDYGTAAVFVGWFQYANFSLTLDGNSFNASNRVLYFGNAAYGDPAEGNFYRVTFTNNWVNSSFDSYAIYNPYDILDFQETTLVFSGNQFVGLGSRTYGIYLDDFRGQTGYDQSFTLRVANNEFTDLTYVGVWFDLVYDFRHVTLDFSGNMFQNTDAITMDYGILGDWGPYYSLDSYDSSFTLQVDGNTALDLGETVVYMVPGTSDGYRDVTISVTGNDFRNTRDTPYMDYGVYLQPFRFDGASSSSLALTVNGNTVRDLDDYAVYVNSFSGFRTVSVEAAGNLFENVLGTWMDYGLYLPVIDDARDLDLSFRDNQAAALNGYAFVGSGVDGMSSTLTRGNIQLTGNTVRDSAGGLYLGTLAYYDGQVTIQSNTLTNVTMVGVYLHEVRQGTALITIAGNTISAATSAWNGATLLYFGPGVFGWDGALADVEITSNVLQGGLYGIRFYGTSGAGATVLLDIHGVTVTGSGYGVGLDAPVASGTNIMSLRIRDSTFQDNRRAFLFLDQPGWGTLPINITGTQVLDFGAQGGYAFDMRYNSGATIRMDVWTSTFRGDAGSLGDVYAGYGPVTMNFHYIDSIKTGEAKDIRQLIRVLWKVDVQVFKGKNLDAPAGGVMVYAEDQYGVRSFTAVTDDSGMVMNQDISGVVIGYRNGASYAEPAVQTLVAEWSGYNGSAVASFTGNRTVTIYLPGDSDSDGIPDSADPDDDNDGIPDERDRNPLSGGFMDFEAPPYNLHLWVLLGLIGAVAVPLAIRIWATGPPKLQRRETEEWTPPEPPQEPQ